MARGDDLAPYVGLALRCIRREYPSQIAHLLRSDADVAAPRRLTPAFCGCFDWHSAVHSHWVLARVARCQPEAPAAQAARSALAETLMEWKLAAEHRYLAARPAFERPYGLAWLLALHAELTGWNDPLGDRCARRLRPLAQLACRRLVAWVRKLPRPIRSGVHSQSALAMGLAIDWARLLRAQEELEALEQRARELHGEDRDYPLHLEPDGEDFLSPSLGAADLMRRVLPGSELGAWLSRAMPQLHTDGTPSWAPVQPADRADGRLAHLDGLSLSRAWMMESLAEALPPHDARIAGLQAGARIHREAGLRRDLGAYYAGAHWLGTFAVYLLTRT